MMLSIISKWLERASASIQLPVSFGEGGIGFDGEAGASSISSSSSLSPTVPLGAGTVNSLGLVSRFDGVSKFSLSSATHSVKPTKSNAFIMRALSSTLTASSLTPSSFALLSLSRIKPATKRLCNLLTSNELVVSTTVASARLEVSKCAAIRAYERSLAPLSASALMQVMEPWSKPPWRESSTGGQPVANFWRFGSGDDVDVSSCSAVQRNDARMGSAAAMISYVYLRLIFFLFLSICWILGISDEIVSCGFELVPIF